MDLGEYKGTINWQLVKVEAGASERLLYESSYEFRSATGLLSWHVPIAFFSKGDQVKIKATATLSALENKPSASAETVVPANFLKYNNIGKPNEIGFGVGLAPNTTCEKIGLIPLPGTEDPESFQYGLYEATAPDDSDDTTIQTYHAYFKYIPRFYYRALSKDGVLLNEEELKELELFTGLTVAQMQEAQRRGGTSAIVLAPDNIFEGFDPEEFGFHLPSAFTESVTTTSYFSSKASGFFISNTLSSFFESTDSDGKKERQFYCGLPSFKFAPTFKYGNGRKQGIVRGDDATPLKEFDLPSSIDCVFGLGHKFTFGETHATCMTFHMWAAIRMLAYAAGLYCKDNTECAWYAEGYNACPCGINEDGAFDSRRPDVQTSPSITETTGTVWVDDEKLYPLTTHNGRINGITNCNGWMQQPVLGICAFHKQILNFTHLTSLSSFEQSYTSMVPEGLLPPPADFTYYTAVWGSSANECNSPFVNYDSTEQADWGRYDFFLPVKSSVASNPESQFGSSSAFVYRYSSPSSSNNTLAVGGYPHALPGHTAGLFCNMPAYGSKVSEDSDVVISPYISFRLGFFV